jgi:hypothetical protein
VLAYRVGNTYVKNTKGSIHIYLRLVRGMSFGGERKKKSNVGKETREMRKAKLKR